MTATCLSRAVSASARTMTWNPGKQPSRGKVQRTLAAFLQRRLPADLINFFMPKPIYYVARRVHQRMAGFAQWFEESLLLVGKTTTPFAIAFALFAGWLPFWQ